LIDPLRRAKEYSWGEGDASGEVGEDGAVVAAAAGSTWSESLPLSSRVLIQLTRSGEMFLLPESFLSPLEKPGVRSSESFFFLSDLDLKSWVAGSFLGFEEEEEEGEAAGEVVPSKLEGAVLRLLATSLPKLLERDPYFILEDIAERAGGAEAEAGAGGAGAGGAGAGGAGEGKREWQGQRKNRKKSGKKKVQT